MKNPSVSGGSSDNGKEAYLAEMRALRKKAGNALLLAPRLMHSINLINGRIMLLVAKLAWTEQSMWSQLKTTPEQDRDMTVRYATGMGESMLRHLWRQVLFDSRELHRLGWQIVEGMPVLNLASASGEVLTLNPTIPERLMSFLCTFPRLGGGLMHGCVSHYLKASLQFLPRERKLWSICCSAEHYGKQLLLLSLCMAQGTHRPRGCLHCGTRYIG